MTWPRLRNDPQLAARWQLPRWLVRTLIAYGVLVGVMAVAIALLVVQMQQRTDSEVQAVYNRVTADLDSRTARRNQQQAEQAADLNRKLCAVIAADLTPSQRTRELQRALACPPPSELPP